MKTGNIYIGLNTQDPIVDAEVDPATAYARVDMHMCKPSEKARAIVEILTDALREQIPDTEMTAYVEAELLKRGMKP
jgi:hypothetical protein